MHDPNGQGVSVVIPTYNNAGTLAEAVASVRAQNWPELEIIVVDDGSTDHTPEALKALTGPDLRIIRQANAGPAAARNAGIAEANREWVAFLDADDIWLPGKLDAQFDALSRRPDARFCFTDSVVRYLDGTEELRACRTTDQPLFRELLSGNLLGTPTMLVHGTCFRDVGVFDPELRTGEDWDLWLRLAFRFAGLHLARSLVIVRKSVDNRLTLETTKYSLDQLEGCTSRVLRRVFSLDNGEAARVGLLGLRGRVYAWHYAVLARSFLKHYRVLAAARLATVAVLCHPAGIRFLLGSEPDW